MISFQPNQAGSFQPIQLINVIGRVCHIDHKFGEPDFLNALKMRAFQTIPIQLIGISSAPHKIKEPK